MEYGMICLLPPVLALVIAIAFKRVLLGLTLGIFSSYLIIGGWNPVTAIVSTIDALIGVLAGAGDTKLLIYTALMGSIVLLSKKSGGVAGFVDYLTVKTKMIKSRKAAMLFAVVLDAMMFINGSLSIIFVGMLSLPIFDKFKISREKLAYLLDCTAAPLRALIPLNAWGAYLMGLIAIQVSDGYVTGEPMSLLLQSLPLQFYSIASLGILILFSVILEKDIGPMRKAEERVAKTGKLMGDEGNAAFIAEQQNSLAGAANGDKWNMIIPMVALVATAFISLYITGNGNLMKGSGSTSVLYAVLVTLVVMYVMYVGRKVMTGKEFSGYMTDGISSMLSIVFLLWVSIAIGGAISELGTGAYLASMIADGMSGAILPFVTFVLGAIMAFCTGTSFGTYSIMFPLVIPLASAVGSNIPLIIGAIVSGGLFGDHCSPLSDTTILSASVTGIPLIDHVKTQMPYAILTAVVASACYLIFGAVL